MNVAGFSLKFRVARYMKLVAGELGCDNSHRSSVCLEIVFAAEFK